jgi:hypothetical protein
MMVANGTISSGGSSRRPRTLLSPRSVAVRFASVGGLAGLGWFILAQTLSQVMTWNGNPAGAYQLAPWDGRNGAALAEVLATPAVGDYTRASALSETALRDDATAVGAAATLASTAKISGQAAKSDRLFAYAERLSRRNLATQLWEIENSVARGDVTGALRHYDIAFRTNAKARELLFPVLSNATDDPEIRAALVATLSLRPLWSDSFVSYVAAVGPDPRSSSLLFAGLRHAGVMVPRAAQSQLVTTLIARNLYSDAWAAYAAGHPTGSSQHSRDPDFTAAVGDDSPAPFDWVPVTTPVISVSVQRSGTKGLLVFSPGANVAGILAQQLQLLRPGDYHLSGRSIGVDQPEASRPYWTLRCQPDGRDLGRVPLPNSAQGNGTFAGNFRVPLACPLQMLALVTPSESDSGVSGQIERVELVPGQR